MSNLLAASSNRSPRTDHFSRAVWKISLETANLEFDVIVVSGDIARRLSRVPRNAQGSIDLVSQSLPSLFFNKRVIQEYHPTIFMMSRFPQLRSMLLLRQSIILHWVGNSTVSVEEIYDDLAFLYDRQVLRLTNLLHCIGINLVPNMDWSQVFSNVSQRIKDWVKHLGTGTRGGNWREFRARSFVPYLDSLSSPTLQGQTLGYGGGGCNIFAGFADRVDAYKGNRKSLYLALFVPSDQTIYASKIRLSPPFSCWIRSSRILTSVNFDLSSTTSVSVISVSPSLTIF